MSLLAQQAQQEQERQDQLLGVKSVVILDQLYEDRYGVWYKHPDDSKFARLHTKFWGKSMLGEGEEWQGSDSNSMHGSYDPDDDVGPGCFVLDIGFEDLRLQNIWVRSEYLRMYDYCNEHYVRN